MERVSNLEELGEYEYFFGLADLSTQTAVKDIKKIFGAKTQLIKQNSSSSPTSSSTKLKIINSDPQLL